MVCESAEIRLESDESRMQLLMDGERACCVFGRDGYCVRHIRRIGVCHLSVRQWHSVLFQRDSLYS